MFTTRELEFINDELERAGETRRWRKATLTERVLRIVDLHLQDKS